MSVRPSLKAMVVTGGVLLALWAASFALSYVALGAWALPVALVIALGKAALVASFFMELPHESLSIKLTVLATVALLVTLIAFMIADISTRAPVPPVPEPRHAQMSRSW